MNKVHRPLALLGALAAALATFPASAEDIVRMPAPRAPAPRLQRSALSRKQRRALAAKLRGSGKATGSKLSRKAAEGKL